MKNWTLTVFLLLAGSTLALAQQNSEFRQGYFITTSGERVEGRIDIARWPSVPAKVSYRKDKETAQIDREEIAEITIPGRYRHLRMTVQMDRSTANPDQLDDDKELEYEEENLLLEVLVDGAAKLYYYKQSQYLERMFYQVGDQPVEQLIYKLYRKENGDLGANMGFKQQLWDKLKCEDIKLAEIGDLRYEYQEITYFFRKYNNCQPASLQAAGFDENARKRSVYLSVTAGPYFGSFSYSRSGVNGTTNLGSTTGVSFGLDLEYVISARNSKWSVFAAPYLHNVKEEYTDGSFEVELDLKAVKVPLGLRYNALKEGRPVWFADAALVFSMDGVSTLSFLGGGDRRVNSATTWALGAGGSITNRLYARAQFAFPALVDSESQATASVYYQHLLLSVGYRLLN